MNAAALLRRLRCSLLRAEASILRAAGLEPPAPALAAAGPWPQPLREEEVEVMEEQSPALLDSILWMAVPKKRRTIEVNRTRRRATENLLKVKLNIEPCPECGHLKQKHILCGFCYAKVCKETAAIRQQIRAMEGGPLRAPATETVVLYEGETPGDTDADKRIVELPRKRPNWFSS